MVETRGCVLLGGLIGACGILLVLGCASSEPTSVAALAGGDAVAAEYGGESLRALSSIEESRIEAKREQLLAGGIKPYDKPNEAAAFFLEQRLSVGMRSYPVEQVQSAAVAARLRQAELVAERALENKTRAVEPMWQSIGPGNIGGRTRAIVINPQNPSIMYAGGVAGGVFKSTNSGSSWVPTGDAMENMAVTSLVMDPNDPNTLYAGTGEGVIAIFPRMFSGLRGAGIFKTTDAGQTWTRLAGTQAPAVPVEAFYFVNKIAISQFDSNRLYASTRTGVWRSLDAGVTWELRLRNTNYLTSGGQAARATGVGFTDIAIRPDLNPDVIFASAGNYHNSLFGPSFEDFVNTENGGLWRSEDGGQTWVEISVGTPLETFNQGRMVIDIAPSNPNTIYVMMANNGAFPSGVGQVGSDVGRFRGLFRSTDGGNTWTTRSEWTPPLGGLSDDVADSLLSNPIFDLCFQSPSSQGWYDAIIRVDPVNENVIWAGGIDLFRSNDGGQNWGVASYWFFDITDPQYVHADQHEIVFHPNYNGSTNRIMFVGNDGGVFRTLNSNLATAASPCFSPPSNLSFSSLNTNYAVTQFYHGDVASNAPIFLGGCQDNGSNMVRSDTNINGWFELTGGDGGYVAIDPRNSDVIYTESQGFPTINKSIDGGITFFDATSGMANDSSLFIVPIAMDKSNPDTLWAGSNRPWRTINGGGLWEPAGPTSFLDSRFISAIGIAPSTSNTVYLGYSNGFIVRSDTALASPPTWFVFGAGNGLPQPGGYISGITVDPIDSSIAYATVSTFGNPHVYVTTDGGLNWLPLTAGLPDVPMHWTAIRPCNRSEIYVGTEVGVFKSINSGNSWEPFNLGFPNTVVETLVFQGNDKLVAFTHGRGAYTIDLVPCDFVPFCSSDITTTNTNPGDPGYGMNDGALNGADLSYFVEQWIIRNIEVADVTTTNTNPGDASYGFPDGFMDGADISFFVEMWILGCF